MVSHICGLHFMMFLSPCSGNGNGRSLMEETTMLALKVHYATAIPRKIDVKIYPTQSCVA